MVSLVSPIEPHEMDKKMLRGFTDMVQRVVHVEAHRGVGHDLLLRVFLAGFHVGSAAQQRFIAKERVNE